MIKSHKCLIPEIVYQATVTTSKDDIEKIYHGLCEAIFEERYQNHTSSFRYEKNKNETELSNYIWTWKKDKIVPSVKWKILRIACEKPTSNYCRLFLTETFFIIISVGYNLDNLIFLSSIFKQSELYTWWLQSMKLRVVCIDSVVSTFI